MTIAIMINYLDSVINADSRLSPSGVIKCCTPDGCQMPDAHWHGTPNGYSNRYCRCRPCKDAWAAYFRGRRSCES